MTRLLSGARETWSSGVSNNSVPWLFSSWSAFEALSFTPPLWPAMLAIVGDEYHLFLARLSGPLLVLIPFLLFLKFEALIGFIEKFINQAASHLANRRHSILPDNIP